MPFLLANQQCQSILLYKAVFICFSLLKVFKNQTCRQLLITTRELILQPTVNMFGIVVKKLYHTETTVPCMHNTCCDRSFAVAGGHVWNTLLAHLRDEDITKYSSFTF